MKNQFQIIGNIGSNIQMNNESDSNALTDNIPNDSNHSKSSKSHTILSIASNSNYKDKEGQWQTNVYWNDVNLFGELAARIHKTYPNGSLILIEGSLSKIKFEDKEGNTRHTTSLVGKSIRLLKVPDKKNTAVEEDYNEFSEINNIDT